MDSNEFLKKMKDYGCDTETAMTRMLDDAEFYYECVESFLGEAEFEKLGQCIDEGDVEAAFESAHTIKGVAGNLGITPIYDCDCLIVEPLRVGTMNGVTENYSKLMDLFTKFKAMFE